MLAQVLLEWYGATPRWRWPPNHSCGLSAMAKAGFTRCSCGCRSNRPGWTWCAACYRALAVAPAPSARGSGWARPSQPRRQRPARPQAEGDAEQGSAKEESDSSSLSAKEKLAGLRGSLAFRSSMPASVLQGIEAEVARLKREDFAS